MMKNLEQIALDQGAGYLGGGRFESSPRIYTPVGRRITGFLSPRVIDQHLAGMCWIGKNCLLITPEDGPRVHWGTVLTDAPLIPGEPLDRSCGRKNMKQLNTTSGNFGS